MKAPFPYFGGKSRIAGEVWKRFGTVKNYVEPFFGSGAMLLNRPDWKPGIRLLETVNDKDGFLSNFWRAVAADPKQVAYHADWPVNENDLHARHSWLVNQRDNITSRLEGNPDYYDVKVAGWWVWGASCWIGSGWCSGKGPWQSVDGIFVNVKTKDGQGVNRKLPHLGSAGQGVNRQLPHLGDNGRGVNRKLPHLGDAGRGVHRHSSGLLEWFYQLAERLRYVRVASGDWSRVTGPSVTHGFGLTAVFLDPPYSDDANRANDLYAKDDLSVSHKVREWAIANGDNPKMRIALCGYDGEHAMPESWTAINWKTNGGYGNQGDVQGAINKHREMIWFSPHCLTDSPSVGNAGEGTLW